MADFFTRMAERALGKRPLVNAVVPSLFAPDPRMGSNLPFEAPATEEGERPAEVPGSTAGIGRMSPSGDHSEAPPQVPAQLSQPPAPLFEIAHPGAPDPPSQPARGTGSSRRGASDRGLAAKPPDQPRESESPRELTPTRQQAHFAQPGSVRGGEGSQPLVPQERSAGFPVYLTSPRPATTREPAETRHPEEEGRRRRDATTGEPPWRPPTAMPPFAPALPSAKAPAGDRSPAGSEPDTIHVTIGRVEVKAVFPPAPPRTAPPARPELSLEDYLKQRKAGRR